MGAPKQKWTSEEENALKAGVVKHGAGKWRTILKDPEFSGVLCLRSNVDLKDKWRNMSVTVSGFGSREKARMALKRSHRSLKNEDNSLAIVSGDDFNDDIVDAKPLAAVKDDVPVSGHKKPLPRMENAIIEAIANLKEPAGSDKIDIAFYIEDEYWSPPEFKRLLSSKLKALTASGKLIKVNRKYRIAPLRLASSEGRKSKLLRLELGQRESSRGKKEEIKPLLKSQIDSELARMRNMTAEEAAAAAAQAVAEADEAMAEAEAAAREAEAAEADAEAAQAFAEAALLTLKNKSAPNLMVRV